MTNAPAAPAATTNENTLTALGVAPRLSAALTNGASIRSANGRNLSSVMV